MSRPAGLSAELSWVEVEGLGRLAVKAVELGPGRLCFKLTCRRPVPRLRLEASWSSPRLAVVDVHAEGLDERECEYGVLDASIKGEEALVAAVLYDGSEAGLKALKAALKLVEAELASRGVKKVEVLYVGAGPSARHVGRGR